MGKGEIRHVEHSQLYVYIVNPETRKLHSHKVYTRKNGSQFYTYQGKRIDVIENMTLYQMPYTMMKTIEKDDIKTYSPGMPQLPRKSRPAVRNTDGTCVEGREEVEVNGVKKCYKMCKPHQERNAMQRCVNMPGHKRYVPTGRPVGRPGKSREEKIAEKELKAQERMLAKKMKFIEDIETGLTDNQIRYRRTQSVARERMPDLLTVQRTGVKLREEKEKRDKKDRERLLSNMLKEHQKKMKKKKKE
jgi:hypothetical protein